MAKKTKKPTMRDLQNEAAASLLPLIPLIKQFAEQTFGPKPAAAVLPNLSGTIHGLDVDPDFMNFMTERDHASVTKDYLLAAESATRLGLEDVSIRCIEAARRHAPRTNEERMKEIEDRQKRAAKREAMMAGDSIPPLLGYDGGLEFTIFGGDRLHLLGLAKITRGHAYDVLFDITGVEADYPPPTVTIRVNNRLHRPETTLNLKETFRLWDDDVEIENLDPQHNARVRAYYRYVPETKSAEA